MCVVLEKKPVFMCGVCGVCGVCVVCCVCCVFCVCVVCALCVVCGMCGVCCVCVVCVVCVVCGRIVVGSPLQGASSILRSMVNSLRFEGLTPHQHMGVFPIWATRS